MSPSDEHPDSRQHAASLHVICGPMFAGKTTLLLKLHAQQKVLSFRSEIMLFKPSGDTRYSTTLAVTHAGESAVAIPVPDAVAMATAARDAAFIFIDEAHFFGTALVPLVSQWLANGKHLVIAGIERDHRGMPFQPFPALLCEADTVTKLSGVCFRCNSELGPAIHSQRLINSDATIVVGGIGAYEARCRVCFQPLLLGALPPAHSPAL